MHDPHHNIETGLAPLRDAAMKGVLCKSNNGNQVLLHVMLIPFVADITETEDLR